MAALPPRPCISVFSEIKTYKNLYPQIYSFENLHTAYRRARANKRNRIDVTAFEFDMEHNLLWLQRELSDHTYRPGPYHSFYIREPKRRLVSAAPFRDRVMHHPLCQIIAPVWERRQIDISSVNTRLPPMPDGSEKRRVSTTKAGTATHWHFGQVFSGNALHVDGHSVWSGFGHFAWAEEQIPF